MPAQIFTSEVQAGEPLQLQGTRIVPYVRSTRFRLPWVTYQLFWNRPASVLVLTREGQEQVVPVPDITRRIQWSLLAGGLVGSLLIWLVGRQKKLPGEM
jgi:hypothetical protein